MDKMNTNEVMETTETEVAGGYESSTSTGSSKGLLKAFGIVAAGVGAVVALGVAVDKKLFDKRAKKKGYVKIEEPKESEDEVIDIDFDELDNDENEEETEE